MAANLKVNKANVAVIFFPGNNDEVDSWVACQQAGMNSVIVRWNSELKKISHFDGFVLPGGWAYEDRIRAGVIASKDHVMEQIKIEAKKGKPVLGICNGAQVLVESGLVPGFTGDMDLALAPNINPFVSGYYCTWVNIKMCSQKKTAFTRLFNADEVVRIPVAHGEGRFTTKIPGLMEKLEREGQLLFKYCDNRGNVVDEFPFNPNGSEHCTAAICNIEGNVMAIMPHPERGNFARNLPNFYGNFRQSEMPTATQKIFDSMKLYIEDMKKRGRWH